MSEFFKPYEYRTVESAYIDHILKERDDLRTRIKKAKEIITDMINEAMLQDSFEDDEGRQVLENARKFLEDT